MENQRLTSESKLFEIPIRVYEKDLNTESGKAKKNEILDIFANFNNIHTEEEFEDIEEVLHEFCRVGDADLIKIYISETVEDDSKDCQYKIDKTNQTASLFRVKKNVTQIIIPRSIKHESTEYLITSISSICNNKIRKIKFAEDSAVKTFYRYAFGISSVEEIYFPTSLKELKEGWCNYTSNLIKITISPSNNQFQFIKKKKYLLGKSDENNNKFDILFFACRDIKEISIPSTIKIISSDAFHDCFYLTKVEFETNSNVFSIGPFSFVKTDINEISIPSTVSKICENAFSDCENLTKVDIQPNSNLQTIEKNAFANTNIKEIFISSKISSIYDRSFYNCKNLTKVEIPINSNLQIIGKFAFSASKIEKIFIPPTVTKICENAFCDCTNLMKVEIPQNSNLQIIESNAFKKTEIKEIFIPPTVTKICKNAFYDCTNLIKVEIPQNSNLQIIEMCAFMNSKIKEFFISSKVSKICEYAFSENLQIVEVSEKTKLESFPLSAFSFSTELVIMIPSNLQKLVQ